MLTGLLCMLCYLFPCCAGRVSEPIISQDPPLLEGWHPEQNKLLGHSRVSKDDLPSQFQKMTTAEIGEYLDWLLSDESDKYDELRSLHDFEQSLQVFQLAQYLALLTENSIQRGRILRGIAKAHLELGDYENAKKYLLHLIDEYEQLVKNGSGDGSYFPDLKETYQLLSVVYLRDRNYSKAVQSLDSAVQMIRKVDSREARSGEANCLQMLGDLHLQLGNLDKALIALDEAGRIAHEVDNNSVEGWARTGIASILFQQGRLDEAIEEYEYVLGLLSRDPRTDSLRTKDRAVVCIKLGQTHSLLGNSEQAMEWYKLALTLLDNDPYNAKGQSSSKALAISLIAGLHFDAGRLDEGLAAANESLAIWAKFDDQLAYEDLIARANLHLLLNDAVSAEHDLRVALQQLKEAMFQFDWTYQIQSGSLDSLHHTGAKLVNLLVDQDRIEEAFELLQSIKALPMIELLARGQVASSDQQTMDAKKAYRCNLAKLQELESLKRELLLEELIGQGNPKIGRQDLSLRIEKCASMITELNQQQQIVKQQLVEEDTRQLILLTGDIPVASTAQVHAELLKPGQALIEYLCLEDKVIAFLLTAGHETKAITTSLNQPIQPADIHLWFDEMVYQTLNRPAGYAGRGSFDGPETLYDLLIAPLAANLEAVDHLIVCPDGPLYSVPFDALIDHQGNLLLDEFSFSYAPSATALTLVEYSEPSGQPLVVGISFKKEERVESPASQLRFPFARDGLGYLRHAREEADKVGEILGCTPEYDSRITEDWLVNHLPGHNIVHISTHGRLSRSPLMSGFFVSRSEESGPQEGDSSKLVDSDGFISTAEILGIPLAGCKLVVLSSCHGTSVDSGNSQGIMGISQGFIIAGSKAVLTSQREIHDKASMMLMAEFYTNWYREGMPMAKALQSAKQSVSQHEDFKLPWYWAPYVLNVRD